MEQQTCRQPDFQCGKRAGAPGSFTQSWLGCDSRYRSIVSQLDLMIELVRGEPRQDLSAELEHLLGTMRDHIETENSYMEMVEFPQALQHGQRHQVICFHTAMLRYRMSKGDLPAAREIAFIRSLWLEHIQVQDRAFEEFLCPVPGHPGAGNQTHFIRSSPPPLTA
jgi:hemerythrin